MRSKRINYLIIVLALILFLSAAFIKTGNIYAAECEPGTSYFCPNMGQCPDGRICRSGHAYCIYDKTGNDDHTWSACQSDGGDSDSCSQCESPKQQPADSGLCITSGIKSRGDWICKEGRRAKFIECNDGTIALEPTDETCSPSDIPLGPCMAHKGVKEKKTEWCNWGKLNTLYLCNDGNEEAQGSEQVCDMTPCMSHKGVKVKKSEQRCVSGILHDVYECFDNSEELQKTDKLCNSNGSGGDDSVCTVTAPTLGKVTTTSSSVNLSWTNGQNSKATYLNASTAKDVNQDGTLKNPDIINSVVTGKTTFEKDKLDAGTYYWNVVSDGCNPPQRKVSALGSVCIAGPATLQTPVIDGHKVILSWTPGTNGTAIYINASTSNALNTDGTLKTPDIINSAVTGQTSFKKDNLTPGTYYWNIVTDGCNPIQRKAAGVRSFVVKAGASISAPISDPNCKGDWDKNGKTDKADLDIWEKAYLSGTGEAHCGDAGITDLKDFHNWWTNYTWSPPPR